MAPTTTFATVAICILVCTTTLVHAVTPVKFGISLSLIAEDASQESQLSTQKECEAGLKIWRDWFNALPASDRMLKFPMNTTGALEIQLEILEDRFNDTIRLQNYRSLASRSDIDFLFAPCGTPQSHDIADMVYLDYGREIIMGSFHPEIPFFVIFAPIFCVFGIEYPRDWFNGFKMASKDCIQTC
jgi:hypothetical protein